MENTAFPGGGCEGDELLMKLIGIEREHREGANLMNDKHFIYQQQSMGEERVDDIKWWLVERVECK